MSAEATAACVRYLTGLLKLVKLHSSLKNVVFSEQIPPFLEALEQVLESERALHLEARESLVLSNKRIVKGVGQANAEEYFHALEELGLCAIWIGRPLQEDEMRRVLRIIQSEVGTEDPCQAILEGLKEWGLLPKVRVVPIGEGGGTADETVIKIGDVEYFPLAYGRLLVLLREYARNTDDAELSRYFRQKLHRAAGELSRLVPRYTRRLMALTTIRNPDDPLFTRLANVGLFALLLGQKLGLSRKQLADLSLSAFLQGIGEAFTEEQSDGRTFHVLREFTRGRELSAKALCTTVVALAAKTSTSDVHPFARIIAVCHAYESLIAGREGGPLLPAEAVQALLEREELDDMAAKAFANLVGVYPIGSCVRLSGGRVAVVVHSNPGFPGRPLVAVARDAEGNPGDGNLVDMAEQDVRGEFRETIAATLDAAAEGVRVSDYLLG